MDKHKLLIGVIFFCAFVLFIGIISKVQNSASNETSQHNTETTVLATDQVPSTIKQDPDDILPQPAKNQAAQDPILQEISDRKFSHDPFIELHSLHAIMRHCIKFENIDDLATYFGIAYPVHEQMNKTLLSQCDSHLEQYPELIKAFKEQSWPNRYKPQSQLGRLLKTVSDRNITDSDRTEVGKMILLEAIRAQNGIILNLVRSYARHNMKAYPFPIIDQLQSHDNKYIYRIDQTALNLISCQFNQGVSCASSAGLMRVACAKNPLACGLDYPSWYEQNTLPGMKKDVQKLIDFYTETALE